VPDPRALAPFTADELDCLVGIADLAAILRTRVPRDGYKGDLVEVIPGAESPTRLAGQLGQFCRGMRAVGVPDGAAWRFVERIGLGSIPPVRRSIVEALTPSGYPKATATLAARARLPETTVRRHLQDLDALGVVDRIPGDGPETWRAGEWLYAAWDRTFGATTDDRSAELDPDDMGARAVQLRLPGYCTKCGAAPPRPSSYGTIGGCEHQGWEPS
jgi:hypothetical protein